MDISWKKEFRENNGPRKIIDMVCFAIFACALILECLALFDDSVALSFIDNIHGFFFETIDNSGCQNTDFSEGLCSSVVSTLNDLSSAKDSYYFNSIIISLFPIIDTIFAISMTISTQKIYGIEYNDFKKLRKYRFYSVTWMISISLSLFVLSIVFYYTQLILTSIALCLVSIIYMFIFMFVEIPLMSGSEHRINDIVAYAYNETFGESGDSYFDKDLFKEVLHFLLTKKGLEETHNVLLKDCDYSYAELKNYFVTVDEKFNEPYVSREQNEENINRMYKIIREYLSLIKKADISIDGEQDADLYAYIADIIYVMKEKIFDDGFRKPQILSSIINDLIPYSDGYYDREHINKNHHIAACSVLNYLLIKSYVHLDTYFFSLIKEKYCVYGYGLITKDNVSDSEPEFDTAVKQMEINANYDVGYFLFVSIYFYYCATYSSSKSTFTKEQKQFFNVDFIKNIKNVLNNNYKEAEETFGLLRDLFYFNNLVKEKPKENGNSYLNDWSDRPSSITWRFKFFDEQYLTDWWITIFLNGNATTEDICRKILGNEDNFSKTDLSQIYLGCFANWGDATIGRKESNTFKTYFDGLDIKCNVNTEPCSEKLDYLTTICNLKS